MNRRILGLLVFTLASVPAQAHFIWIVPASADTAKAKVVFSDSLEPDDGVPIAKIAKTKLFVRGADGKVSPLDWKKGEHAYLVNLPAESTAAGGVCDYGVLQRGDSKPYLLAYYPKLVRGDVAAAKAWDKLPLEIVCHGAGRFQVLFWGKPAADAEVVIVQAPGRDAGEKLRTDARGEFTFRAAHAGVYGLRARHIEAKTGKHDGKDYAEARHYATLVFAVAPAKKEAAPIKKAAYPPLPRAVSSFGAAVHDGWVYVYGGHCARTHQYSTESVVGTFHRLELSDPTRWEELPGGPGLQGLALVAHCGKIYRLGGMQPRNRPGDGADNHSLATCARFDPATGKWEALPDLPAGRSAHDAVVVGDKIIVVGGWKLNGNGKKPAWHDTALVLDLKREPLAWQALKQPFQRRALIAAVHDGKVYVIGGMTPDSSTELTVSVYDPGKDDWTTGPELPGPRRNGFSPAALGVGARLYVSPADGRLLRLAAAGARWEEVGRLAQPRIVHRLVAANDHLLVAIGGAAKGENVGLTEALVPR